MEEIKSLPLKERSEKLLDWAYESLLKKNTSWAVGKKIYIIEDSAQSHFAFNGNSKNVKQNKFSVASCYSFYPAKNLGAYGDAGMVCTNNINFYKKTKHTS